MLVVVVVVFILVVVLAVIVLVVVVVALMVVAAMVVVLVVVVLVVVVVVVVVVLVVVVVVVLVVVFFMLVVVMVVVVVRMDGCGGGRFGHGAHCLVVMWYCHIGVADVSGCVVGCERSLTDMGGCQWQWAAVMVVGSVGCGRWCRARGGHHGGMVVVEEQDA